MTLGTFGSTLSDELNRLANGGTYRDSSQMVDEALAAKQWANRENIVPYSTDTVGILNEIAALGPNRQNWFDFNGVCNYLAGTTGLPAAAALRQITTTGDILTSLAAFYVDAATPYGSSNSGFVYLNGSAGNYISTPDAAALDITGDIDLRAYIAPDTWIPATASTIISKWLSTGNQRSFRFQITTTGLLSLAWTTDGATGTLIQVNSTVATGLLNSQAKWVRVTLDVSNGASGYDVAFYLSDNGTTWTQLGTTVTAAGTASIYSGSANVEIGSLISGTTENFAGEVFRAQILNGIGGTTVLDANCSVVTSQAQTSFTATTGQAMSIFKTSEQMNVVSNLGSAGSLLPITVGSSTAADSNDAKFLDHTGTNYVYLPGASNNYLYVADSAALDITGDIDMRVQAALDDWTPAAEQQFIFKFLVPSTGGSGYAFFISNDGKLNLWINPTQLARIQVVSTVATGIADGTLKWVRVTLDADNGAGGYDVKFWTSDNGTTWTQLGTTITTAGVITTLGVNDQPIAIGCRNDQTSPLSGKIYRAQIFGSINDTNKVLDVDTSVITSGADTYVVPTTYTGQAGAYFTGSGLSLNGVAGNYVSTPDSTPLDITGDLDVQVKVAMTDWTPSAVNYLIGKYNSSNISYSLRVDAAGTLALVYSTNGTATTVRTSTVATGITDGATKWVRATLDVDNGASGNDVKFYLSDDGSTWTQLGATVTNAGTTSIFSGTAILEIGSIFAGTTGPAAGTFYEAIVKSGIDGYTVFDADFTQVPANALRMTESSINKAVVTLNTTRYAAISRSTSGRKTVAVTQPTWLFGTDDYMEVNNRYMAHSTSDENYVYLSGAAGNSMSVADNPPLDITGDLDIQVRVALDDWTPASTNNLISKWSAVNSNAAYVLQLTNTGNLQFIVYFGSSSQSVTSTTTPTIADGATLWVRATLDVDNGASGNDVKFFTSTDGTNWTQLGTTITTAGVISLNNSTEPLFVGGLSAGIFPARGKFYRAIIKNGIDGTTVLDANAAVITLPSQTTFTDSSSNAYTVTINKSGVGTFVSTGNYLYLPGINSNQATASDSPALDITGDIDVRAKIAADDWTPAAVSNILAKWQVTGNQRSWRFALNTNGGLFAEWSANGTTVLSHFIGPIGITDGATKWVRWTLDVDNGASGNDSKFFTSDDGLTWTQASTTQTTAGVTSIYNSTAALEIGAVGGQNTLRGDFFRTQILNGIGGTVVFDANFESSITSLNQASFTESSSNAATVTINRSGSTYRSAGVIDAGYLYPGATNTFSNSTIDYLNFGATDSFTVLTVNRLWTTPTSFGTLIGKRTADANWGYVIRTNGTAVNPQSYVVSSGTLVSNTVATTVTAGTLQQIGTIINRGTNTIATFQNGTTATGTSISTVGSVSNVATLQIGALNVGANSPQDFEFIGAAVFRTVLTPAQIRQVTNYFANREAYL